MTTAALVFVSLLLVAAVTVTTLSAAALRPVRMAGPAVRRWGGLVLVVVGAWFVVLAALPPRILGG